jgi:hypothetical protein
VCVCVCVYRCMCVYKYIYVPLLLGRDWKRKLFYNFQKCQFLDKLTGLQDTDKTTNKHFTDQLSKYIKGQAKNKF